MIEKNELFYKSKNLFVCAKHFDDEDIKKFIGKNGRQGNCSFCNAEFLDEDEEKMTVVSWDVFIEYFSEALSNFYTDPVNELPWNHGYDEEVFHIYDTNELLQDVIGLEAEYEIIEEITDTLNTTLWVEEDYFGLEEHEALRYDWEEFSNTVKHKIRYIFHKFKSQHTFNGINRRLDEILEDIGSYILELNLIKEFPEKTHLYNQSLNLYRARQHKKSEIIEQSENIGSAPNKYAGANRFSAEGISMFYGAEDIQTAKLETINYKRQDELISIGKFKPSKPLILIDLRNIPYIGMFNLEDKEYYNASHFLRNFVNSISIKFNEDDNERIEYVPSQVATEYFRYILPEKAKKTIHGIVYKSIQNSGKDCYAIFADIDMCADEGKENKNTLLVLEKNSIVKEIVNHKSVINYKNETILSVNSENFKDELIKNIDLNNSVFVSSLYKKKKINRNGKKVTQYEFQKTFFLDKFKDFSGNNINEFSGVYIFSEKLSASEMKPVYIGISRNLKRRMSDHLIRKNKSSASWADLMDKYEYNKNLMPLIEKHPNIDNLKVFFLKIDDSFKLHLAEILLVLHYKPKWNSFKTH